MAFRNELLAIVGDIPFEIYKVTTTFNPTSSLSKVDLTLDVYEETSNMSYVIRARDLFELDMLENKPENQQVFEFITNSRSKPWPPLMPKDFIEKDVMVAVCQNIFVPLSSRCNEVVLEKGYRKLVSESGLGLETDEIGMGTWDTWHGTADVRVKGCEVVCRRVSRMELADDEDEEEDDTGSGDEATSSGTKGATRSDGATAMIEGEKKTNSSNLAQVVATCVISSFTEKKLHPTQQALVPTVLIDLSGYQVCLYDCVLDVLLISTPKSLSNKNGLSRSALLLLWLTINHR